MKIKLILLKVIIYLSFFNVASGENNPFASPINSVEIFFIQADNESQSFENLGMQLDGQVYRKGNLCYGNIDLGATTDTSAENKILKLDHVKVSAMKGKQSNSLSESEIVLFEVEYIQNNQLQKLNFELPMKFASIGEVMHGELTRDGVLKLFVDYNMGFGLSYLSANPTNFTKNNGEKVECGGGLGPMFDMNFKLGLNFADFVKIAGFGKTSVTYSLSGTMKLTAGVEVSVNPLAGHSSVTHHEFNKINSSDSNDPAAVSETLWQAGVGIRFVFN